MPHAADLPSTFMPSLAWALLDFVWQGMLVGWCAALLFALMRKARPQARYLVGCGALLLCVALPLSGVIVRMADRAPEQVLTSALLPLAAGEPSVPGVPQVALAATGQLIGWRDALQERLPLVLALWACGAGLLALRMVLGLAWVRSRSRAGQSRRDPLRQAQLSRMAQRFGITRPVTLGIVDDLSSPVTAGWWRPVVLVPAALIARIPPDLLEALVAHELAHIRRHDYLVNLVQGAIEIVLFYHPTVWWLSGRVRAEREQIADDLAASMLGEPRRLALALSELDRLQLVTPTLAHAAHGGNLMTRIQRLVSPTSEPLNWKIALPILGLAAACAGFYANAAHASGPGTPVAEQTAHVEKAGGQAAAAAGADAARAASGAARAANKAAVHASHAAAAGAAHAAHAGHAAHAARAAGRAGTASRHISHGSDGEPYAIVRRGNEGSTMHGGRGDRDDIDAARRSVDGEFIWFRQGGQAYVIQDAGVLARATSAWAPVDQLGKQMNGLGDQMREHGKAMEALGRDMSAAAAKSKPSDAKVRQFETRIRELAGQQVRLASAIALKSINAGKGTGAERQAAEREIDRLEKQMDAIEKQIDAESDTFEAYAEGQAHGDMEAIGRKMELAGQPMEALGEQMDVLGERMDVESRAADKAMRALIEDARARGLARPAPRS